MSALARLKRYRVLLWLALAIFAADQASKTWILTRFPEVTYGAPDHIEIIPGFFNIVHVHNTGAAWSLLSGKSALLAILALVTLACIVIFRRHLGLAERRTQFAFGLLCGGITGNLIDRAMHGHVIDFLDFHFGSYIYPTFNIADSAIVVGAFTYAVLSLRENKTTQTPSNP